MRKLLWPLLICLCLAASPVFGAAITDKSIGGLIDVLELGETDEIYIGGGGTGNVGVWTTCTGTGAPVRATSPTLVTPALGIPGSGTLTSCTGLPISTGVSGLAANVATFLGTPSSTNLIAALTDETGTGAAVFAESPTLTGTVIAANIDGSGTISGNLFTPDAADGADIGTVDLEFSDAYFANAAVLYFQADQSVTMTSGASGLTFNMFPITPSAAPDADYEVANKKYVDENAGAGGNVATDPIWDAAGDLAQGTGAHTAAKLSLGTALALLKVNAAGNSVEWGTAGQITFPSTAVLSADPNTLDDYEEGTWTPTIFRDETTSVTYTEQTGTYIKIGGQVTLGFKITISAIATQGASYNEIKGNPFTVAANYVYSGSVGAFSIMSASDIISVIAVGTSFFPVTDAGVNPIENFAIGTISGTITIFI